MGEVISFKAGKELSRPKSGLEYLFLCKETLTIDDYEEVLLSIMDEQYYQAADPELQAIVNEYFQFDK